MNFDGVRMRDFAVGFRFGDEAIDELLVAAKIPVELLDRDFLIDALLFCIDGDKDRPPEPESAE